MEEKKILSEEMLKDVSGGTIDGGLEATCPFCGKHVAARSSSYFWSYTHACGAVITREKWVLTAKKDGETREFSDIYWYDYYGPEYFE